MPGEIPGTMALTLSFIGGKSLQIKGGVNMPEILDRLSPRYIVDEKVGYRHHRHRQMVE
jgi:hypothetical protein